MNIKIIDTMFLKDDLTAKKLQQKVSLSPAISVALLREGYMDECAIFECQDDSVNSGKPYETAVVTLDVSSGDTVHRETFHTSSEAFINDLRFIKEVYAQEMELSEEQIKPYVEVIEIPSKKYAGKNIYRLMLA